MEKKWKKTIEKGNIIFLSAEVHGPDSSGVGGLTTVAALLKYIRIEREREFIHQPIYSG